jgi:predicted  nucleic acid-binding Zn-ribbon protein
MESELQELAGEYVSLAARIKDEANALTAMRKDLKKLDARLLEEMRKAEVMEVTFRGVIIQRTTKLQVKT